MGNLDEAYNYLTDQIGTVFALANGVGGIAEAYDYDAYGAPYRLLPGLDGMLFTTDDVRQALSPVAALSLFDNPYAFQGRRYEPSSGYYDYRARFYDADLGTWLTRDPAGFVNGSNLYQFVGSLPRTLDPFGLCGRERGVLEHLRDGAAGFIDGAISGLTFGLVGTTIWRALAGARAAPTFRRRRCGRGTPIARLRSARVGAGRPAERLCVSRALSVV